MLSLENYLLVCDMDGTLLQTDQGISQKNLSAIRNFVDRGGLFTVATGRNEKSVESYLDRLPINVPGILYNGAAIYDFSNKSFIQEWRLPDVTKEIIRQLMVRFPDIGVEVYRNGVVYYPFENEITTMHRNREGFIPDMKNLESIPENWHKVVLGIDPDQIQTVFEFLQTKKSHFDLVQSEPHFIELLPKGANKGSALRILSRLIGISLDRTIAIGDNLNDFEMIQEAGFGFAVDNAHPNLKEIADHECADHNNHAIADLIQKVEKMIEGGKYDA